MILFSHLRISNITYAYVHPRRSFYEKNLNATYFVRGLLVILLTDGPPLLFYFKSQYKIILKKKKMVKVVSIAIIIQGPGSSLTALV